MSSTSNLLEETVSYLKDCGKNPSDVRWVGSVSYGYFDWEYFAKIADVEYYNGFGGQEVASDLKVVGDDWWLERHEYDGSEWWEYKSLPTKPDSKIEPARVIRTKYSGSLEEINRDK